MSHEEHGNHLCSYKITDKNMEDYKKLVKGGEYVCQHCGRVAVRAEDLCGPVHL